MSFSTQFLVVSLIAFYTATFSSKHFFLGLFVRTLSIQLFFLVFLLLLLLSMIAFSYLALLSLFWVRLFHALYLSHLPPSSFLEGLSSEQFAELESVHLMAFSARACSLAFLSSVSPFLAVCRAVLIYFFFRVCSKTLLSLVILLFQLFKRLIFLILLRPTLWVFFYRAFLSGSVLSSTPYIRLPCLLRMHAIDSCVGDT